MQVHGIYFLNIKKFELSKFSDEWKSVYYDAMNNASDQKWCVTLSERQINIHVGECLGWPSIVTDKLKPRIEEQIKEQRRFTMNETVWHETFDSKQSSLLWNKAKQK